jgi:hypothetical protein
MTPPLNGILFSRTGSHRKECDVSLLCAAQRIIGSNFAQLCVKFFICKNSLQFTSLAWQNTLLLCCKKCTTLRAYSYFFNIMHVPEAISCNVRQPKPLKVNNLLLRWKSNIVFFQNCLHTLFLFLFSRKTSTQNDQKIYSKPKKNRFFGSQTFSGRVHKSADVSVAEWVCEKIAQNVAQTFLCQN